MNFKIPKEFQVGGKTFQVKTLPGLSKGGAHGLTKYDEGEILIDSDLKPVDLKAITFYHEQVHAILDTMGKPMLRDDEDFVDSMANLIWQCEKTRKY